MVDPARSRLTAEDVIARADAATVGLDARARGLALDVLLIEPDVMAVMEGPDGARVREWLGRGVPVRPPAPASLTTPLDAALYYASALGWAVFPLHTARAGRCSCSKAECKQPGKHPRTEHGFKDASKDPAQIRKWWRQYPDAPVGVATGDASGFVVVDVDLDKGGPERLSELEQQHGMLPSTPTSHTGGGGSHLLFALPGAPLGDSNSRIARGIDVRATGGYIVAPPSSHASGRSYAWRPGAEPWTLPLAPMPLWLFERARVAPRLVPDAAPVVAGDHPLSERIKRASAYLQRVPGAVSGERGHDTTWSAALPVVRGFDLPRAVAVQLLWEEYNPRCRPPWTREEIEHKVDGAMVPAGENPAPLGYLLDDPQRARPAPPRRTPEAARAEEWDEETGEVRETEPPLDEVEEPPPDLPALLAVLLATPKERRSAAALDPALVHAASLLPDTSPEFQQLRADVKAAGGPMGAWDKAVLLARPPAPPRPTPAVAPPVSAPPAPPNGEEWRAFLTMARGEVKQSYGNLVLVLRHAPAYKGRLSYNEMRLTPCLDGRPLGDADVGVLREQLERAFGLEMSADNIKQGVRQIAEERRFHPVQDYLSTLTWDGTPRIEDVAHRILGIAKPPENEDAEPPPPPGPEDKPSPYRLAVRMLKAWFVSAVARAMRPGCKVDTALVLVGPQGFLKSTFFSVLGGPFFSDTAMDISGKDGLMQLHAAWIYEWGEIENVTSKKHSAEVKGFVTSPSDNFRPPYGSATTINPRSTIIVGSTNEEQFLNDGTGSRRFHVLLIEKKIDIVLLRQWRDQLWAEACRLFADGYEWWLREAEEEAREAEAEKHKIEEATVEAVRRWLDTPEAQKILAGNGGHLFPADILQHAFKLDPGRWGRSEQTRVGIVMAALRWGKERPMIGGVRIGVYKPPGAR